MNIPVLRSPVPAGYPGRQITRTERNELQSHGHAIPVRARIMRAVDDVDYLGHVMRPCMSGSGYYGTGIRVTTKN